MLIVRTELSSVSCVAFRVSIGEEKCDVTLPWQQNFWITTMGDLSNDNGDGNEHGIKAIGLYWQNNNFARASRFLYNSYPSLQDRDMNLPNFTRPLYGVCNIKSFLL